VKTGARIGAYGCERQIVGIAPAGSERTSPILNQRHTLPAARIFPGRERFVVGVSQAGHGFGAVVGAFDQL
jgi:hypothetical protein